MHVQTHNTQEAMSVTSVSIGVNETISVSTPAGIVTLVADKGVVTIYIPPNVTVSILRVALSND